MNHTSAYIILILVSLQAGQRAPSVTHIGSYTFPVSPAVPYEAWTYHHITHNFIFSLKIQYVLNCLSIACVLRQLKTRRPYECSSSINSQIELEKYTG